MRYFGFLLQEFTLMQWPQDSNQIGFAMLRGEVSSKLETLAACAQLGALETWRRLDDGLTYAFDSLDTELWNHNLERFGQLEEEIHSLGPLLANREDALRSAVRFFKEAARNGDLEGHWNLGWRLHLGEGIAQDDSKARQCWEHAAAYGHRGAAKKLEELGWAD